jgi:hypothetical protein
MRLRPVTTHPKHLIKAIYNMFLMRNYHTLVPRIKGQK